MILWFGWFGFNGGSELAINSRSINAVYVSNISASIGGITWMLTEMLHKKSRKMSLNGFCCGVIAGLVSITPAAGFVSAYYALIFGFVGTLCCFAVTELKHFILKNYEFDDACDVFAVHGVGGMVKSTSPYKLIYEFIFKNDYILDCIFYIDWLLTYWYIRREEDCNDGWW